MKKNDIIARLDTTTLRAEMVKSEAELAIAQAKLARVMSGPHESEITQAKIEVTAIAAQPYSNKAEATAQASDLAAAQARLDYLLALPLPEDVAVAQAEVNQAQLNVEAADALLKQAWLVAPSDGTVVRVLLKTHEYANVGETVAQMSNLEKLSVQTTVYDFEVVSISIGETATVSFDALPGIVVEGSVYSIIPDEGDEQSGKYTIMIRLNEILEGLRWGLTANIEFPTE